MPFVLIIILVIVSTRLVDIGLDQSQYTAAIFAGDVSASTVGLLVTAILVGWLLGSITGLLTDIIEEIINRNLRRLVWRRLVHLPLSFVRQSPPREAVSRVTTDPEVVGSFLMRTIYPLLVSLYSTYAVLRRVTQFDWRLSAVLIVFMPVLALVAWGIGRFRFYTSRDVTVRNADLTQQIAESVTSVGLIKSFGVVEREQARGSHLLGLLRRARIRAGVIASVSTLMYGTIGLIQTVVLILVGVALINSGDLTTGQWIAFYLYSGTLTANLSSFTGVWESLKSVQGSTARIAEIVDADPEPAGGDAMPEGDSDIELAGIAFTYGRAPVLTGVDATVPHGRLTVVIGPSGSGKSTLLRIIQRLEAPDAGSVRIHGRDASDLDLAQYRRAFASVTQDGPILAGTVRDNLLLGLLDAPHGVGPALPDDDALLEALRLGGDDDFLSGLPRGLDTEVGDHGLALSGGQRHRVALARALLREAPYLLLDEPTAGMDAAAAADALERLRAARGQRTCVLVSHSTQAIAIADHVIVLDGGTVLAQGAPHDPSVRAATEYTHELIEREEQALPSAAHDDDDEEER